jgi:hypothetical protein
MIGDLTASAEFHHFTELLHDAAWQGLNKIFEGPLCNAP